MNSRLDAHDCRTGRQVYYVLLNGIVPSMALALFGAAPEEPNPGIAIRYSFSLSQQESGAGAVGAGGEEAQAQAVRADFQRSGLAATFSSSLLVRHRANGRRCDRGGMGGWGWGGIPGQGV